MLNKSETIGKIATALNAAQKNITSAKKDSTNPYFKSKFADLSAVIEACKDALNNEGITILQPHRTEVLAGSNELVTYVDTVLLHVSGEYLTSSTRVEVGKKNDPQALGIGISYARRYGLQSFISLPAEDDDGEGAMNRSGTSFSKPAAAQTSVAAAPAASTEEKPRQRFRRNTETAAPAKATTQGENHEI